ncbi:MAG: DegT/DnrJ/EryC1/StrS family aminotransferase [Actinomycetota bacterium]|nr:DegT/DnrJ/EryC1/StrS family aminotransferase [Actinomycetota bacterium]
MTENAVPILDTRAEYAEIKNEIDAAVHAVLDSGRFVGGPEVTGFEEDLSTIADGRRAAAVNSGTDALRLALSALGVGSEDEVILPGNTFSATAMAVEAVGATPVIADVDSELHVLTADTVEPLITRETKCVIPVHLYGHPAPMPELMDLARARGIAVLEDAAQAHRATIDGRPTGAWGDAAAFSFYPSKNLGAYGDGGAVVGSDDVVEQVCMMRDLGRDASGEHVVFGINSRLDAFQAAILRVKLRHLERWEEARRSNAANYVAELAGTPIGLPTEAPWAKHVYHLFVVTLDERDRVMQQLADAGISTGVHYPTPIHHQPAHQGRVKVPGPTPVCDDLAGRILSLPVHPQMSEAQQERVISALKEAV